MVGGPYLLGSVMGVVGGTYLLGSVMGVVGVSTEELKLLSVLLLRPSPAPPGSRSDIITR